MKIHGINFRTTIIQQVGGILGNEPHIYDPVEYVPKAKEKSVGALPISDGQGHFIVVAEATDANGVDLFLVFYLGGLS